uniref:tRNA-uridine aminocarboxypropyltransferase n=1 Tax=Sarcophilus harrisii TaxID=9305 RepID=A0A7N4PVM6_SARHA
METEAAVDGSKEAALAGSIAGLTESFISLEKARESESSVESATATLSFPAPENGGDCADGLWELPVEQALRRPECSRCRDPELSAICRNPGTLILYPGAEAINLEELISNSPNHLSTIIIIDGTWSQAKDIFYKNSLFRLPRQVQLKTSVSSQYVIRTQPTNRCLSTLECAAVALSILEKNDHIQETLLRPLQALCSFQLQHGAQIRLSKEHLLKNGLYPKPMPKNKRKLRKMELLMNSVKI